MKPLLIVLSLFLFFACNESTNEQNADQGQYAEEKTAPFSAVKFEEDKTWVQIESEWFQFLKMDTWEADWLIKECKIVYNDKYKKRFSEDLVEFLHGLDIKPHTQETFTLKNEAGESIEKQLTFSKENRNLCKDFYRETYETSKAINPDQPITKALMLQDIDTFEDILTKHHSYLHLKGLDIDQELNALRNSLPEQQRIQDFGTQLKKFINKLGDGHARVDRWDIKDMGILPFNTQAFQGKVICYKDQELLDEAYPYLASINGIPVEELLKTSRAYFLPDIAPHFVHTFAAYRLNRIGFLLTQHNAYQDKLEIKLINDQNKTRTKTFNIQTSGASNSSFDMKPVSAKIIEDNIGYIKISQMASGMQEEVQAAMEKLSQTEGLVIDVRNNGGGSREILLELMPYFIPANHPPVIGNLGVYRTDDTEIPDEGVLRNRFMYPLTSKKFTQTDRDHIKEFMASFTPSFNVDPEKYTDWHFLLIKHDPNKKIYTKPLVVLMNEGCFSATDIFLSSFDQLEHVQLIGTTSGGGSGRTQGHILPNSNWNLRLSSIISFQPNGKLYDGVGVSPDRVVPRASIDDLLGKTDNQLSIALEHIHKQSQK